MLPHWSTAAGLQRAAVLAEQVQVVQPLQHLVAELGVADAVLAGEPRGDGVLLDHLVDPEVLPMSRRKSIADSGAVQSRLLTITRGVVALEVQERPHLALDAGHPLGDRLAGVELRAPPSGFGSPISPVEPPTRHSTRWPARCRWRSTDQLHQVADVQAGGGGVEAAVHRDRPVGECLAQRGLVGGLGHQATPVQLVEDVAHGASFPSGVGRVRPQPALPRRAGTTRFRSAVRRDGGVAVQPEPPRVLRPVAAGAAHADARAGADQRRRRRAGRPGPRTGRPAR